MILKAQCYSLPKVGAVIGVSSHGLHVFASLAPPVCALTINMGVPAFAASPLTAGMWAATLVVRLRIDVGRDGRCCTIVTTSA